MPKTANLGTVERNASTEVYVPLYTSITQLANGNTANFEIKPKTIIMAEIEYIIEASWLTTTW